MFHRQSVCVCVNIYVYIAYLSLLVYIEYTSATTLKRTIYCSLRVSVWIDLLQRFGA